MAISQITYATKSDISTTSAPASNKVQASDLNEIKTVVNGNANNIGDISQLTTTSTNLVGAINEVNNKTNIYDGTEQLTNKTWFGKPVYRKVIQTTNVMGTEVQIQHGISNVEKIISYEINSIGINSPHTTYFLSEQSTGTLLRPIRADNTKLYADIGNGFDSNWTVSHIIEYTKTV